VGFFTSTVPLPGEPAAGLYSALCNRARSILSGEHAAAPETLLPACWWPLESQDLDDPDFFFRSNPSIDVTVPKQWLIQQRVIAAANPDSAALNDFGSQHLNAHIEGASTGIDSWNLAPYWSHWSHPSLDLDRLLRESRAIVCGIDAGGMDDLTSIVVIGATADGRCLVWSHCWLTRQWPSPCSRRARRPVFTILPTSRCKPQGQALSGRRAPYLSGGPMQDLPADISSELFYLRQEGRDLKADLMPVKKEGEGAEVDSMP
jgi:phage terminase large subunit-like protein